MPAKQSATVDRQLLYDPFNAKLDALYEACLARGVEYWIICGTRTWPEQAAEFAKGRDAAGKVVNPKAVVTKAPPGSSPHNFMVAVDWCRNFNSGGKLDPRWPQQKAFHYQVLREEAEKLGLESGLSWKFTDPPHIQLPLEKHGLSWALLRRAHAKGGDQGVKALLDAAGPW